MRPSWADHSPPVHPIPGLNVEAPKGRYPPRLPMSAEDARLCRYIPDGPFDMALTDILKATNTPSAANHAGSHGSISLWRKVGHNGAKRGQRMEG